MATSKTGNIICLFYLFISDKETIIQFQGGPDLNMEFAMIENKYLLKVFQNVTYLDLHMLF